MNRKTQKEATAMPSGQSEHATQGKTSKRVWLGMFGGVILVLVIGLSVSYQKYEEFIESPISGLSEPMVVQIKPGSSVARIAQLLHQKGLLAKPDWFVWYVRYVDKQHVFKAGEFWIDPQWRVEELIDGLENAKNVQYPATIVAGQTIQQTLQTIQSLPKLKIELDIEDIKGLQAAFGISEPVDPRYPYASLEGRFLPETYHYQLGDSDKDILLRAFNAAQEVLQQAWETRAPDLPYQTPYEALIMASIVEKETGYAPERPLIAGVFVRRLQRGMRLQTDPTVIYGIGQDYDGNIRKRDLLTKTPYNTYKINRLPPTPIALPSEEAINATLNPAETKALYFVAKGEGKHHFSNTLVEHNRAVRKYILNK